MAIFNSFLYVYQMVSKSQKFSNTGQRFNRTAMLLQYTMSWAAEAEFIYFPHCVSQLYFALRENYNYTHWQATIRFHGWRFAHGWRLFGVFPWLVSDQVSSQQFNGADIQQMRSCLEVLKLLFVWKCWVNIPNEIAI